MIRLITLLVLMMSGPLAAGEVTVFAAASLGSVLEDMAHGFSRATGHHVRLSLAGSSVLARQIGFGAPADVFISANPGWMDTVEAQGLLVPGSRFDVAGNALVLIGKGAWQPGQPLPEGRIAMALVDAVPAGIYGKQALTALGLWPEVQARVVQTDNVRAALALVALGETPLGIVYASDASAEPAVAVLGVFPANSHDPIRYPAAAIQPGSDAALAFLAYLKTNVAAEALRRHGFLLPEPAG